MWMSVERRGFRRWWASLLWILACGDGLGYRADGPLDGGVDGLAKPAVLVAPRKDLQTNEGGSSDGFVVVLATQPQAEVTLSLRSLDASEGSVSPEAMIFTPEDWGEPQNAFVVGIDDDEADGVVTYLIEVSNVRSDDPAYDGLDPDDVEVVNFDDDEAGVVLLDQEGGRVQKLVTSEAGVQVRMALVLSSRPGAPVTLFPTSSLVSEGHVAPEQLTFTSANWFQSQWLTVTGVDDFRVDGDQAYTVGIGTLRSDDPNYDGLVGPLLTGVNGDDDRPGLEIKREGDPVTDESGTRKAELLVSLKTEPAGQVVVVPEIHGANEGELVSAESLVFDADNWGKGQSVVVRGLDDPDLDGDQPYFLFFDSTTSDDPLYKDLVATSVPLINRDDDKAGFRVTQAGAAVVSPLETSEAGTSTRFEVALTARPTARVQLNLVGNDSEGALGVHQLLFFPTSWNTSQVVTLTGVDDLERDGDVHYAIEFDPSQSLDTHFVSARPKPLQIVNRDDD